MLDVSRTNEKKQPNHIVYDEEAFNNLVDMVGNHEVSESVSDDPKQLAALKTSPEEDYGQKTPKMIFVVL